MTMNQLMNRLARNAADFLLAGEKEKSDACMSVIKAIQDGGFENVKGVLNV